MSDSAPQPTPESGQRIGTKQVLLIYGVFAGLAFLWGYIRGDLNIFVHPEGPHGPTGPLVTVGSGIVLGLLVVFLTWVTQRYFNWSRFLSQEFKRMLGPRTDFDIAVLAVSSGVAEELFFRGAMQPTLGIVWSSLIFGFLHIGPDRRFIPWTIFATVLGFIFALLFWYTGDLMAVILAHFTINFFNLKLIYRQP